MPRARRRVSVALLQSASGTVFRVRDWGPGVEGDDLSGIFERDFSTKPGHAGVGLHLVESVVRRTGGKVSVERRRAGGLAVSVAYES